LTRCRNQASKCRFRDKPIESDDRLIEHLIVGTKHKKIQDRLLEKGEQLTFNDEDRRSRSSASKNHRDGGERDLSDYHRTSNIFGISPRHIELLFIKSLAQNTDHAHEKNIPIKDKDD